MSDRKTATKISSSSNNNASFQSITSEELNDLRGEILERTKEISEERVKTIKRYQLLTNCVVLSVCLFFTAIFVLVFTPLGDFFSIKTGWVIPKSPDPSLVPNAPAVTAATRNMITVLGPMVIGLVLWMLATVGMNRFKAFDASLEAIRNSLEEKLEIFRKEARQRDRENRTSIREEIEKNIESDVQSKVGEATAESLGSTERRFDEIKEELAVEIANVEATRTEIEERFGHIASATKYSKVDDTFGAFTSVGAVHDKVTELLSGLQGASKDRKQAITLTQEMLDVFRRNDGGIRPAGSLKGDWFNLSAVLGRNDEEALALDVCLAGLEQQNGAPLFTSSGKAQWKNSAIQPDDDVLAHAIKYAHTINDPKLPVLLELNGYDSKKKKGAPTWGWRSYAFSMQALESLGRIDEAIALGEQFAKLDIVDGDTSKVVEDIMSIKWRSGAKADAIAYGKTWLANNPYAPAAQVITTLLEWTDTTDKVEEIIALANRGVRDLAEAQTSSNLGNILHRRALARDKRVMDIEMDGQFEGLDVCHEIHLALKDYETAQKMGVHPDLVLNIRNRMELLRSVASDLGCNVGGSTSKNHASNDHSDTASFELNDSGEAEGIEDKVRGILVGLLPILGANDMDAEGKAKLISAELSKLGSPVKELVIQFLSQMREDDDAPDEMKHTLKSIWPMLDV